MPRTRGTIERVNKQTGRVDVLPVDYRVGKMSRATKRRSGFWRTGRNGKRKYIEPHYQRYWYGGQNFGARPIAKQIDQPSAGWSPQSARKRYMETSTLRQRLLDNKQKATEKREPIFGRDEHGEILFDPLTEGNVAIHPDEWWLWVSQPNQYDIAKVDEPLPEGMYFVLESGGGDDRVKRGRSVSDFNFNPYLEDQSVEITLFDEDNSAIGYIYLGLEDGKSIGTDIIRESKADDLAIPVEKRKRIRGKPHLVEVPIYSGWTAEPSLEVYKGYRGKGYATFLIREAFDLGDRHNISAEIHAVPDPSLTDPADQIASQAFLRSMYTSFGLKANRSMKEIMENPSALVRMQGIPYSEREKNIKRGRYLINPITGEVESTSIDVSIHPDTAEYSSMPRKPLEPRPYKITGQRIKHDPEGFKHKSKKTIKIKRRP